MDPFIQLIQPSGILNGTKGKQLRQYIDDLVTTGVDIVLIDLEQVTFMDSSGLGALIAAQRIARTANCKLFICSIKEQPKMLFELTKMDQLFEIFTDREEFNATFISKVTK